MVKKQKKQTRRAFLSLPISEQMMQVRILHTGKLTTEEISERLGVEVRKVKEILYNLHLKPNMPRVFEDDGYHIRVDKI